VPLEIGDVIQIIKKEHKWFPCILIASEIKSFGCLAYVIAPIPLGDEGCTIGEYYIYLQMEDYELIGRAAEPFPIENK